ncbi:MAG: PPC domain-containing DNA-binding protein [Thermomicrobiales bacterium]
MKAKLLQDQGEKIYAVVFDKDDECMAGLLQFATEKGLDSAELTAVGAFSRATLGYFDRQQKEYQKIPVEEQVEVLSLLGNIALDKGKPKVHAHTVIGKADGTTRGGHVLEGYVWPTLEVIVTETPRQLRRRMDAESGLALIDPEA